MQNGGMKKNTLQKPLPNECEAIFYDFDGVMTDNCVYLNEDGKELVMVNRSDGLAISFIRKLGIQQIIISTESNTVVIKRANKLKIPVINNVQDKKSTIEQYCKVHNINTEKTIFVGNDINDLSVHEICGFFYAPCDAEIEVLAIADRVSSKPGGHGVIRELYRLLVE